MYILYYIYIYVLNEAPTPAQEPARFLQFLDDLFADRFGKNSEATWWPVPTPLVFEAHILLYHSASGSRTF